MGNLDHLNVVRLALHRCPLPLDQAVAGVRASIRVQVLETTQALARVRDLVFHRPAIHTAPLEILPIVSLTLADGSVWFCSAGDEPSAYTVSRLAAAMQLKPVSGETDGWDTFTGTAIHRLNISTSFPAFETGTVGYDLQDAAIDHKHNGRKATDLGHHALLPWVRSITRQAHVTKCVLNPIKNDGMLASQLAILSLIIAREVELGSGLLLHGALVERDGKGVILAGPSGSGKTTISRRLPPPWRSPCDDTTLLIRDDQGVYWAHPWPTWSNFMFGGQGGSWDVHHAVRLEGIFFLNQATEDMVSQVGSAAATCLLNEVAEQVSRLMLYTMSPDEVRAHRLRRFETICSTAKQAPVFRLRMSPAGTFWREIEEVLHQNGGIS